MPSITDSLRNNLNLQGFSQHSPEGSPVIENLIPSKRSPFIRCPVPQIGILSSDNLEQAHLDGYLPQYRIFVLNK